MCMREYCLNELFDCKQTPPVVSTVARFNNFHVSEKIKNAVVLFAESYNFNPKIKNQVRASCDLIYKIFDIDNCDAYEIRTAHFYRHNCLRTSAITASSDDWDKAIQAGKDIEKKWLNECNPCLPGFKIKNVKDSVSAEENIYFEQCKFLLLERMKSHNKLMELFYSESEIFAKKFGVDVVNCQLYLIEEMTWFLSYPLLYWGKDVYFVHVGKISPCIVEEFRTFPLLAKHVRLLVPHCQDDVIFKNEADFLMCYKGSPYSGFSFAVESPETIKKLF